MKYLVAGRPLQAQDAAFGDALAALQTPRRVFCMCVQPPVEMYVPFARGQHGLSCMPGTASKHAPGCSHYEPPLSISGAAAVMGSAIESNDVGDVTLRLDFPMSKITGKAPPSPSGLTPETAKVDPTKLTMRALLHYLWQEAGFHKWSPRMEGKRNHWVLHKYLLKAAAGKRIKAGTLSDVLVIPRPNSSQPVGAAGAHSAVDVHVALQLACAATDPNGGRRLALVLGEVLHIEDRSTPRRFFLRGMDKGLLVTDDLFKMVERAFSGQLAMWQSGSNRLMMLATFYNDTVGNPVLSELTLMNTSLDFLPFESVFEEQMIARLVASHRRFNKGLRFNLNRKIQIATAVLTDTETPLAIFILNPGADEDLLNVQVGEAERENLATLVWRAGIDSEPVLPAVYHAGTAH